MILLPGFKWTTRYFLSIFERSYKNLKQIVDINEQEQLVIENLIKTIKENNRFTF